MNPFSSPRLLSVFLSVSFFVFGAFAIPLHGQQPTQIQVLSYNIHHANPPSKPDSIDLPAIARVIRQSSADLVALQEVDVHTERSGKTVHQAESLAELTGMYAYFSSSIPFQGGEYGNAILSRYPIQASEKIFLSTTEGTEPRALLLATIGLPNGEKVLFAATHLDFSNPDITARQARDIIEKLKNQPIPVILAGDFNATPGTEAINELDRHFERTCWEDCPPTIPVLLPKRTIDFIFFNREKNVRVLHHEVIEETYASDHLPVKAVLAW
ncbi:endonuclease/exonuclease/phosphatase family protein [Cyclobacterium xiamenense]|jgi:endonuclease/exonuclease/phosphatase family metal-dependent hydrolase|uniref:endonuclease/exonuclease/phosphatase family protein n=1 Tax=Cyclobacterium xiamenense TaxID=1297121 RepID=UPI0035CFD75B